MSVLAWIEKEEQKEEEVMVSVGALHELALPP
jgi:hypothetical protein